MPVYVELTEAERDLIADALYEYAVELEPDEEASEEARTLARRLEPKER